jgi:hypothetical protein
MASDPRPELDVGGRIEPDDDLLRVIDHLMDAKRGRHHEHTGDRPPGRARLLRPLLRQGSLPPVRDPAQAQHHQNGR